MPTYEYKCGKCGHEFEVFQGIKDAALKKCPRCGKDELKRLISAGAGLIFKGSGFYITDYAHKSGSYSDACKKDGPPAPPAKTETKAETASKPTEVKNNPTKSKRKDN